MSDNSEEQLLVKLKEAIIADLDADGYETPGCEELRLLLSVAEVLNPKCEFKHSRLVASQIAELLTHLAIEKLCNREFSDECQSALQQASYWELLKCMIQKGCDYTDYHFILIYPAEACEAVTGCPGPTRDAVVAVNILYVGDPTSGRLEDGIDSAYAVMFRRIQKLAETEPLLNDPGDIDIYADDHGDDDLDGLFGFKIEDHLIIESFIGAAKAALSRDDVSNSDRIKLVKFMHCMQQMPRVTPNVSLDFSLKTPESRESLGYRSLQITGGEFKVSAGEYVMGPFGGDSSSQTLFEVGEGWQDTCLMKSDLLGWAQQFEADASDEGLVVSIEDYAGEEIDMDDAEDTSHLWEKLDSEYA